MRRACASLLHRRQHLLPDTSAANRLRTKLSLPGVNGPPFRPISSAANGLCCCSNTGEGLVPLVSLARNGAACAAQKCYLSSSAAASQAHMSEDGSEGTTERHEFKAETQKLLQIVTHSLYTDKEVFIRELISNAADALEKLRFLQTTQQQGVHQEGELRVILKADPSSKTLTIEDTGVGMTRKELMENLGTIARSGSLEFLKTAGPDAGKDIIGQFGVGFYSAFVVAEHVEVYTRAGESEEALCWASDGSGSFTVTRKTPEEAALRGTRGTRIVCKLKPECAEFANPHRVKECAKKYSAFISYPVYMDEGGKEELVASQEALWLKSSATQEEHTQFFRFLSNQSWGEPLYSIMFSVDAPLSVRAVLYFPADPPNRLFQTGPLESGVSLHSRRVLVKKSAAELLPKWLWFLRGVVDCEDLPLNVSREHVQDSQLQRKLSTVVVKRILKFLNDQAKSDPEKYKAFYQKYSQNIKEGVLEDAHSGGTYKDMLLPLLRFECSTYEPGAFITLDEYLEKMPAKRKNIYYYCCSDRKEQEHHQMTSSFTKGEPSVPIRACVEIHPLLPTALASPYMEHFVARGKPVILMTADIDEFLTMNLSEFKGKKFVAVDSPEDEVGADEEAADEEKDAAAASQPADGQTFKLAPEQQTELSAFIKETLGSRVTAIKFSERLVSSPAVVSGFLSPTLRKMMHATLQGAAEAQLNIASLPVTLELHPSHELISALYHLKTSNPDVARLLVEQLLDNACVAAGILDEPKSMLTRLNKLLSLTAQYAYHHKGAEPSSVASSHAETSQGSETTPSPQTETKA
ncbi:hypothetical protein Emed_007095 [Eimeria media]